MSDIEEVFYQLFYGSGMWLGALLMITIIILLGLKSKWGGMVTLPFTLFMGINYITLEGAELIHYWVGLMFFLTSIFTMITISKK